MSKCYPSPSLAASGAVGGRNSVYHGYTITVVTATAAINIRDGSVSGQIIDVIPAATAVGTTKYLADGVTIDDGIFVDFNGASGTVVVLYE
jgi:hypothetical protein